MALVSFSAGLPAGLWEALWCFFWNFIQFYICLQVLQHGDHLVSPCLPDVCGKLCGVSADKSYYSLTIVCMVNHTDGTRVRMSETANLELLKPG